MNNAIATLAGILARNANPDSPLYCQLRRIEIDAIADAIGHLSPCAEDRS